MNEQIKELLAQSGLQPYYDAQEGQIEKFAELIIRECADFVAAGEFGDPGTAKQLMECFGVEEKNNE
jgi:hypothetical protein